MIGRWIDKKEMVDCVWRSEHIGKKKRKKDHNHPASLQAGKLEWTLTQNPKITLVASPPNMSLTRVL